MGLDRVSIPAELKDLLPDQLQGVQAYLALQAKYARKQRNTVLMLALVVTTACIFGAFAPDSSVPFDTLAEVAMRYATLAATGLALVSVVFFEFLAHRDRKNIHRWLSLTPEQARCVRELGDGVTRYILLGSWFARLGLKK